ncbi:MAG TPA: response regulator [Candidatus Limnocylindrales bacterium]|nr:response regulator [Candidatus Limnocylindrales bacterium]
MPDAAADLTVLVVEDEAPNRALARAVLSRATDARLRSVRLIEAVDLREARTVLAAERVSIVLLDVRLPDGNGLDLARELRQQGEGRPHVLILTASVLPTEREAAVRSGADAFLAKPYRPADLISAIVGLIGEPVGGEG